MLCRSASGERSEKGFERVDFGLGRGGHLGDEMWIVTTPHAKRRTDIGSGVAYMYSRGVWIQIAPNRFDSLDELFELAATTGEVRLGVQRRVVRQPVEHQQRVGASAFDRAEQFTNLCPVECQVREQTDEQHHR